MTTDVIISKEGRAGRVTLNRPKALHALTLSICEQMTEALLSWINDDSVEFVIVDHLEGSRGFCAGGDITMLAKSGASDGAAAREFFQTEYRLNDLISRYPKPYIAMMDGVTMGGGVGISVHGRYRVATERTTFAMPETGIGLFPDVGGTWFLPKLSGEVGTWLALTGARVKGADVAALGLATHFCESAQLSALKSSLIDGGIEVLDNYMPEGECSFAEHLAEIDTLFAGDCALTIKGRLEEGSEWAKGQASKLNTASPLSTKIALHQMRTKESLGSLQDALTLEYRVACRMVQSNDFQEGVRAVLIDKDQSPKWHPASLPATSADMVLQYFSPLDTGELSFLEI